MFTAKSGHWHEHAILITLLASMDDYRSLRRPSGQQIIYLLHIWPTSERSLAIQSTHTLVTLSGSHLLPSEKLLTFHALSLSSFHVIFSPIFFKISLFKSILLVLFR